MRTLLLRLARSCLATADQIITRLDGVLELVYPFQAEDV
jgi:hypothetical protein